MHFIRKLSAVCVFFFNRQMVAVKQFVLYLGLASYGEFEDGRRRKCQEMSDNAA